MLHITRAEVVADRLHAAAIHLLRRVRHQDYEAMEIGPAALSALSVLVSVGPCTLGQLAAAEHVKPPTMSRLVSALERGLLVTRVADPTDRRGVRIATTRLGRAVLRRGRGRRIQALAARLCTLKNHQLDRLAEAPELMEHLAGEGARGRNPPRSGTRA